MLDVGVHAFLGAGRRRLPGHLAGHEAVLGVVLKVSAREGGAVDVHGGGIPAGDNAGVLVVTPVAVAGQGILAHVAAVEVGVLPVPAGGQVGGAGIGDGIRLVGDAALIQAGGAVKIDRPGLAGIGVGQGLIAAVADEVMDLGRGHLVNEGVPDGVGHHNLPGEAVLLAVAADPAALGAVGLGGRCRSSPDG